MHYIAALPFEHDTANLNDDAALARAARQDLSAFATLYQRYRDRVYWYLRSRTGSEEDAADLTQQVFLQAIDALPSYHATRGTFAAWLFRIARNAAIDLHRQQQRGNAASWDLLPGALQSLVGPDLEAQAMRREDLVRLRTLLGALDPPKRELLALRFAARLPVTDIAAVIGKSAVATRKQLSRTIQALQEQYDGDK